MSRPSTPFPAPAASNSDSGISGTARLAYAVLRAGRLEFGLRNLGNREAYLRRSSPATRDLDSESAGAAIQETFAVPRPRLGIWIPSPQERQFKNPSAGTAIQETFAVPRPRLGIWIPSPQERQTKLKPLPPHFCIARCSHDWGEGFGVGETSFSTRDSQSSW